jgi:DNA polymerase III alpha subunit (gram-positive type)
MPGAEEIIINSTPDVRPVVLVFHDSHSDIKYLAHLGYDLYAARNVLEAVDTQEMNKYITRADNSSALGSVLTRLKMASMHLHNAGNDAVYTLQIMIGLAVEKRLLSLAKHLTKGKKEQKS